MVKRLLLGPQRPIRNLGDAFARAGFPDGPIAVVSAGWQEAEADIDDVYELVQRPLVDLRLYKRADELFAADSQLRDAYRNRQNKLKELQRLHRLRLRQLSIAARETLRVEGDHAMLAAEQRHAISQLRALDRHHLHSVQGIHASFDAEFHTSGSALLAEHAAAINQTLAECDIVLITGGNVIVLLNRLRLFGVDRLLSDKHLIAWSAGAMVLSDLIVLYHDRTPQGRRDPELLSDGIGTLPGFVFLPDAKRRLREKDTVRTGLISRRFAPAVSVTLDSGSTLLFEDRELRSAENAKRITRGGRLTRIRAT